MKGRIVILEVVARPLYGLILAASVWVLLRGHNEPGGGFIGGLLAVTASVLWAVAHGSAAAAPITAGANTAATGASAAANATFLAPREKAVSPSTSAVKQAAAVAMPTAVAEAG